MTKEAMRRLIQDAYSMSRAEEAICEELAQRLDYAAIAETIVDRYESEFMELATDIIAEEVLPF